MVEDVIHKLLEVRVSLAGIIRNSQALGKVIVILAFPEYTRFETDDTIKCGYHVRVLVERLSELWVLYLLAVEELNPKSVLDGILQHLLAVLVIWVIRITEELLGVVVELLLVCCAYRSKELGDVRIEARFAHLLPQRIHAKRSCIRV